MRKNINELFEIQVLETPNNIAIIDRKEEITYKKLNEKVNRFTNYLIKIGVKKDDRICLVMNHSINMIIAIFSIIKTGATYIPMEPNFPTKRINFIIKESNSKFVITEKKHKNIFEYVNKNIYYNEEEYITESVDNPKNINIGSTAAYVLYTSGTTGIPKGVIVEHRNVYNYIKAFKDFFKITEKDKMLQASVCTFDIFVEEVFPILMTGGTLVIVSSDKINNSIELFNIIKEQKITITSTFPYFLNDIDKYIKESKEIPQSWKIAISGGDILIKEYISKISERVKVFNTYGPTETTVCASYYEFEKDYKLTETVPIGKPINNVKIYILDENMSEVPNGEIGEICISGEGVSRGYLNQKEKMNASFIVNPFNTNERLYKTGDLGKVLPDGNLDFLKRKDRQVMIWGKRVEPLEVEGVMLRNSNIKDAVVRPFMDSRGYNYLTAYYIINNEGQDENINEIKSEMAGYLPEFMIPEFFVKMNGFPLSINGKINFKNFPTIMK